jgi:hypothetical protein
LPRKYAIGGIGVPRRRLSVPFSRSVAIPAPRVMKEVEATPPATMPPTNSCDPVMPVPATAPEKTLPSSTSMMTGSVKVKTTELLSRKNVRSSTVARARPSGIAPGRAVG